ncbi:hypothetical protein [Xanthomonas axonopodis]|uniref:hypothetical protein n=1 Tax=Xanthomonas axonopodis TaxID=53413 RepID=UPI000F010594|nr:hypothetical protein [Xanthomonas axonopodis]AYO95603.1 hypothetical protein Xcom_11850 [Xanthomonas axonopodis pv. commiphoreae]
MRMLDGISQCYWLSNDCVVNWDAWSAIGTVAAVFAAVFAPAIQRRFVRGKANALFAFAYLQDIVEARSCLRSVDVAYPLLADTVAGHWCDANLRLKADARREYSELMSKALSSLAKREVDLAKWPAVDLEVAAGVVIAIETTKALLTAANAFPDLEPSKFDDGMTTLRRATNVALEATAMAQKNGEKLVGRLIKEHKRRALRE